MKSLIAVVSSAFLLVACGGGGGEETAGEDTTGTTSDCVDVSAESSPVVVAVDNEFEPSCLQVAEGQDLTVRNDGAAAHTFTIEEADIDVVVQPGEEAVATGVGDAASGGEATFICQFHPGMEGTLQLAS